MADDVDANSLIEKYSALDLAPEEDDILVLEENDDASEDDKLSLQVIGNFSLQDLLI